MGQFETEDPKLYFIDALTRSFRHFGDDTDNHRVMHIIEYISGTFSGYVNVENAPDPRSERVTLDLLDGKLDYKILGDKCLWVAGMCPEIGSKLAHVKYYQGVGSFCYRTLDRFSDTGLSIFADLSQNFPIYAQRINHARNKSLRKSDILHDAVLMLDKRFCSKAVN